MIEKVSIDEGDQPGSSRQSAQDMPQRGRRGYSNGLFRNIPPRARVQPYPNQRHANPPGPTANVSFFSISNIEEKLG